MKRFSIIAMLFAIASASFADPYSRGITATTTAQTIRSLLPAGSPTSAQEVTLQNRSAVTIYIGDSSLVDSTDNGIAVLPGQTWTLRAPGNRINTRAYYARTDSATGLLVVHFEVQ